MSIAVDRPSWVACKVDLVSEVMRQISAKTNRSKGAHRIMEFWNNMFNCRYNVAEALQYELERLWVQGCLRTSVYLTTLP